jgi:heme/copper-type cytochrome/quinol oxidase subunit 4
MSLVDICQWIQNTEIGTSIRESIWVFPIIESTHVLALSLSVGTLLWMDLRLTGLGMKNQPVSKVTRSLLPWSLIGFIIMFITGILLFWCQALKAYNSIFFRIKVVLLLAAGINALVYHTTVFLRMDEWDKAPVPPLGARVAGWCSMIFWMGIIVAGRTMAYNL